MKTFVFLDDLRKPWGPEWHLVKTADECIEVLKQGGVEHLSLDHDLAEEHYTDQDGVEHSEKTGYHVVLWMAENNVWPSKTLIIHTMNSIGRTRMLQTAQRYAPAGLQIAVKIPTKMDGVYTALKELDELVGKNR